MGLEDGQLDGLRERRICALGDLGAAWDVEIVGADADDR